MTLFDFQNRTERLIGLSMLLAMALVLSYIERFLPMIFPGARIGLANAVILVSLLHFSLPEVALLVILKTVLTAFLGGNASSFFYSLSGGLASWLVMGMIIRYWPTSFSLVGISLAGGVAHNFGQALVLGFFVGNFQVSLWWLPYLILLGMVSGSLIGAVTDRLNQRLNKLQRPFH